MQSWITFDTELKTTLNTYIYIYKYFFFFQRILIFNPQKRIGALDALQHEYFREFHDGNKENTQGSYQNMTRQRESMPALWQVFQVRFEKVIMERNCNQITCNLVCFEMVLFVTHCKIFQQNWNITDRKSKLTGKRFFSSSKELAIIVESV